MPRGYKNPPVPHRPHHHAVGAQTAQATPSSPRDKKPCVNCSGKGCGLCQPDRLTVQSDPPPKAA